jgi:phosphohistidine phosphatase
MRQLILLRHAEAEPARPGAGDIDRPLTDRGRQEALAAAEAIATVQLHIDEVLASPALRTRETADLVAGRLNLAVPVNHVAALYLGAPNALLLALQNCRPAAQTLLMIGHNPGISEFAHRLAHAAEGVALRTAGVCRLTWPHDSWDRVATTDASAFEVLR